MNRIKRGDVYYVASIFSEVGSEQKAGRPAIVVSNDLNNKHSEVIEVVYLTTKPKANVPTHVGIKSLREDSIALCEQVSSVSVQRLSELKASITEEEMKQIDDALLISLALSGGSVSDDLNDAVELQTAKVERDLYKKMYEDLYRLVREKNMKVVTTE